MPRMEEHHSAQLCRIGCHRLGAADLDEEHVCLRRMLELALHDFPGELEVGGYGHQDDKPGVRKDDGAPV